jgi:hypothetical protein
MRLVPELLRLPDPIKAAAGSTPGGWVCGKCGWMRQAILSRIFSRLSYLFHVAGLISRTVKVHAAFHFPRP